MLNVLIVDDNPFNLDIINEYMEDEGYKTICMKSPVFALEYLEKNIGGIDIILLDRMMPHMSGTELAQKIKGDNRLRDIPIIMISALSDQERADEVEKSSVYKYLTKPFERDDLLATIKEVQAKIKK